MKYKSTVTIELEADGSKAILEVKKLKHNEHKEVLAKLRLNQNDGVTELNDKILQNVQSVSGLFLDDKEVLVEDIQSGNVTQDIANAIIAAYFVSSSPREASEKNDSKAE